MLLKKLIQGPSRVSMLSGSAIRSFSQLQSSETTTTTSETTTDSEGPSKVRNRIDPLKG